MLTSVDGSHWINHPAHGKSLIATLNGMVKKLNDSREDDPLLYACEILDDIKKIAGLVIAIEKWAYAVNESTPDQIYDEGAQPCL